MQRSFVFCPGSLLSEVSLNRPLEGDLALAQLGDVSRAGWQIGGMVSDDYERGPAERDLFEWKRNLQSRSRQRCKDTNSPRPRRTTAPSASR